MGQSVELTAADGHRLNGYLAQPAGQPRAGVVIIQEIFGITSHIRAVTDRYAADGFLAIAPALFDRVERNVDVPYTDMQRGFGYVKALKTDEAMLDIDSAVTRAGTAGKVAVVGFCWGGTLAYLAAARLKIAAAVAYYGGGIHNHLGEKPQVPVMFHFGEKDAHIPLSAVGQIKAACPQGVYHLYPADHGFNCTDRSSYEPASAKLALQRTLEFLHQHTD